LKRLIDHLAKLPVIKELELEQIKALSQLAAYKEYDKGETIAHIGEIWPNLLIVDKGSINLVKTSSEGRTLTLRNVKQDEPFWAHSLFSEEPMPVSLITAEKCSIYLWHQSDFMPMVDQNTKALKAVCEVLSKRVMQCTQVIDDLAFQHLSSRLARMLLNQFEGADQAPVPRDITLDEMASRLGTTREMVCKLLYRFADDDLITITRTELYFNNKQRLEKIAHSNH